METRGKPARSTFRVGASYEQGEAGEGRAHVSFVEDDRSLVIHFQAWERDDGPPEWRNYGFTFEGHLHEGDVSRDSVSAEMLQRVVDQYPYWLNLARTIVETPHLADNRPSKSLKRGSWKPAQPGRSPAFRSEIADEFVRRFDAGENAVTEIARAHGVTPGTVSKWLTKVDDPRVNERRESRYKRGQTRQLLVKQTG